ncbi:hypothetical protein ACFQZJ_06365 [Maribacter chungangensis]|uniref:Porin family protein n=1 Tax=Maribacter chungangensis TaxID=1069117 RepID=A0ABW3B2H4_9FLAO
MKKITVVLVALLSTAYMNAQTDQGNFLIEANTGFGGLASHPASTSFRLVSVDGETDFSVGAEAGYFIADDLAIKVGLGYADADETFTFKGGVKYYLFSNIPLQIDIAGASGQGNQNPLWLGGQGGYAIFINDNVSIEPGFRYNYSLNQDFADVGVLEFNVGFVIFI